MTTYDAAYQAQQDAEREWVEEGGEEARANADAGGEQVTDIADLVAKLDAWQRECAMLRVEPKGITTRELTELRRIVVAAKEWAEGEESMTPDRTLRWNLLAAVRGVPVQAGHLRGHL